MGEGGGDDRVVDRVSPLLSPLPHAGEGRREAAGRGRLGWVRGRFEIVPLLCYVPVMTVEDIEKAIKKLGAAEFDRLREWFDEYQAARFDEKIARDAEAGKLDHLADQAVADFRKGRAREL